MYPNDARLGIPSSLTPLERILPSHGFRRRSTIQSSRKQDLSLSEEQNRKAFVLNLSRSRSFSSQARATSTITTNSQIYDADLHVANMPVALFSRRYLVWVTLSLIMSPSPIANVAAASKVIRLLGEGPGKYICRLSPDVSLENKSYLPFTRNTELGVEVIRADPGNKEIRVYSCNILPKVWGAAGKVEAEKAIEIMGE